MRQDPVSGPRWTRVSISIGVGLFILALTLSAVFVPQLRLLHLFQALIYVAVIVLTERNSPWGFGAGVIIPAAWNCLNLFVTHLFQAGAGQFWSLVRTGHVSRPDTLMVMIGGVAHFLLIIACMAGFIQLRPRMKLAAIDRAGKDAMILSGLTVSSLQLSHTEIASDNLLSIVTGMLASANGRCLPSQFQLIRLFRRELPSPCRSSCEASRTSSLSRKVL